MELSHYVALCEFVSLGNILVELSLYIIYFVKLYFCAKLIFLAAIGYSYRVISFCNSTRLVCGIVSPDYRKWMFYNMKNYH